MLGSLLTGMGSVLTADGDNNQGASGLIVPRDWREFAEFFILSKMPAMKSASWWTDFMDSQIDWSTTANAEFPISNFAGEAGLRTVFLAGAIGYSFPKPPVNNSSDYFRSMLNAPWAIAARSRSLAPAGVNSRHGYVVCCQLGQSTSLCIGLRGDPGPGSTSFLSAWTMNGNNVTNVLPVVTTIPWKGAGPWHEVYVTYDGAGAQIWGGGDFNSGIEPFLGGEFLEFSVIGDVLCHPSTSVQSIDGVTNEQMSSLTMLGKAPLPL